MSIERIVFLLLAFLLPAAPALAEAPATMRVDFYHSGNHEMEIFSLDQVVFEPLPWTGNMHRPIDETLRGKYLFEIVDPGTSAVAWSRSFSSIYGEWETTREARNMNRTYHESVRFPAQADEFELVLKKRNATNGFDYWATATRRTSTTNLSPKPGNWQTYCSRLHPSKSARTTSTYGRWHQRRPSPAYPGPRREPTATPRLARPMTRSAPNDTS
jgi:hypothetical protein